MITTIFFDIGKVLVGFDHTLIWQRLAKVSPFSAHEIQQRIQGSELMNLHETGKLGPLDFFHEVQRKGHLNHAVSYEEFSRLWADIFWEQSEIIRLATSLQQHYVIGLLSNVGEIHWNWLVSKFPFFGQANILLLSFQVGHLKPSTEIYQEAIRQSHSQPQQCVYIDDIAAYVNASRQFGIHGIHYRSPEQLQSELKQLHVLD